ncbi:MAG: ABC transporter permease [Veillonellales bacterium]
MSIKDIVIKEIRFIFKREPIIIFLLLGVGAAYTTLMGLLYSANVMNHVPMIIYDQDQTQLSRSLIQALDDSEKFQIVADVLSQEEMESMLRDQIGYCALSIPPNYSRDIKNGFGSNLLFELNASNLVFDGAVISMVQEIVSNYLSSIKMGLLEAAGQLPSQALSHVAPIQFRLRVLNNPTLNYTSFFVLGIFFVAFQTGVMMAVSMTMANEYKKFQELRNTAAVKVLFAKLLPYWIGGIGGFIASILIAVDVFGVPFRGSVASLLFLGTVFIFVITSLASLLPAFCTNQVFLLQLVVSYAVPCFLFSGYTWPRYAMNLFGWTISCIIPVTYIADNVRDLALHGYAPDLQISIIFLLTAGTALFALSTALYSWRRKQAANSMV